MSQWCVELTMWATSDWREILNVIQLQKSKLGNLANHDMAEGSNYDNKMIIQPNKSYDRRMILEPDLSNLSAMKTVRARPKSLQELTFRKAKT